METFTVFHSGNLGEDRLINLSNYEWYVLADFRYWNICVFVHMCLYNCPVSAKPLKIIFRNPPLYPFIGLISWWYFWFLYSFLSSYLRAHMSGGKLILFKLLFETQLRLCQQDSNHLAVYTKFRWLQMLDSTWEACWVRKMVERLGWKSRKCISERQHLVSIYLSHYPSFTSTGGF